MAKSKPKKVAAPAAPEKTDAPAPTPVRASRKYTEHPTQPCVELKGQAFGVDRSSGDRVEGVMDQTIYMIVQTESDVDRLQRIRREKKFGVVRTHNFEKLAPELRELFESEVTLIKNPPERDVEE